MRRTIIACLLLAGCGGALFIETGEQVFSRRFKTLVGHYESLIYPEHLKGNKRRVCEIEKDRLVDIVKLCDEAERAGVQTNCDTYRKQQPEDCDKLTDT